MKVLQSIEKMNYFNEKKAEQAFKKQITSKFPEAANSSSTKDFPSPSRNQPGYSSLDVRQNESVNVILIADRKN
jgi:hypothetical protein